MKRLKPKNPIARFAPLVLSLLAACAAGQDIPPPGGPPDKEPPVIRKSVPADGTTNFREQKISIAFNEYLNEGDIQNQLVITPIPERPPEINWSGKTLGIEFRDPLRANRTYAVTLGAGVQDLSGNRLGTPYTLRFSTGPIIDSGRIGGVVTEKGDREAFIFAYNIPGDEKTFSDTLRPDLTMPDFIAPVGDNGAYSLEGLPPGRYRLFAVADEFSDRLYSPGTDAFGIAVRDVTVDSGYSPVPQVNIRLAPAPIDLSGPQLFSAAAVNSSRSELRFSEPIDTATIRPENFRLTVNGTPVTISAAWRSATNRTAVLLAHTPLQPGQKGEAEVMDLRDSVGLQLVDTARSASFTTTSRRDSLPPALQPIPGIDKGYRPGDTLQIAFDEGVEIPAADNIVLMADTATGEIERFRLIRRSPAEFIALPTDTIFKGVSALLTVDLRSIPDYEGNRTDSVWKKSVQIKPTPQRGSLQGALTDSAAPNTVHIILLEAKEEKWKYRIRIQGTGAWEIRDIPSGDYNLRAFRDDNGNGEFDYGSISPYRPGEVFTERPGGIQVRPRWTTTNVDLEL